MDVDDKVCEQVSMTMLSQVYPTEAIERCVQQSEPWASKARRVRLSTLVGLVLFVLGMTRREPTQPMPSVAKPGGPDQRYPPRPTGQHDQRLGPLRTTPGLGFSRLASAHGRPLPTDRSAWQHAECLLWALSAHGHRWHPLQHAGYARQSGGLWWQ